MLPKPIHRNHLRKISLWFSFHNTVLRLEITSHGSALVVNLNKAWLFKEHQAETGQTCLDEQAELSHG